MNNLTTTDFYLIASIATGFLIIASGMVIALILLHRQKHHDGLEWNDPLDRSTDNLPDETLDKWTDNEKGGY